MTDEHVHDRRGPSDGQSGMLADLRRHAQKHIERQRVPSQNRKVETLTDLRRRAERLYDARRGLNSPSTGGTPCKKQVSKSKEHEKAIKDNSPSRESTELERLQFYSAYCHKASPTYFKWVNLTAWEVHTVLQIKDGYTHSWQSIPRRSNNATPQILFYLNHPIQFVQVVGVVISFEEYFERFWLFTIDDSSGASIDVVCPKPAKHQTVSHQAEPEEEEDAESQARTRLSSTIIANVRIGVLLQVKGTITLFQRFSNAGRNAFLPGNSHKHTTQVSDESVRQITLERFAIVHDTNQELQLLEARTSFHRDVLCKPWRVTKDEQKRLHKEAMGQVDRQKRQTKHSRDTTDKKLERDHADICAIAALYEQEEVERLVEAGKARTAGALLRQNADAVIHSLEVPVKEEELIKKKKKKRKSSVKPVPVASVDDSTLRFAPDDAEKSALLRAAFG